MTQHYGEWLRGYDWKIVGCLTYCNPMAEGRAVAMFKRFFERMEVALRIKISYYAVLEYRYSGCGLSPIPKHWHFLASSSASGAEMQSLAAVIWQDRLRLGNCQIDIYDPAGEAAFYVTKLIESPNAVFLDWNMHLMNYHGPLDLLDAARGNPYVPDHLKNRTHGEFLAVRRFQNAA